MTEADRNPIVAAQVPAAAVPASPGIEIVPSHAAGQIVQSALIPDVVALSPRMAEPSITAKAAAPVSSEPSSMAPGTILPSAAPAQSVAAAKPIELAALPQELEPPMPGSIVTTVPLAGPSNVCVPEAAQVNKVSPARLAALGGETGGGYVDPIAFGMELAASAREQLDDFTVYTDQYRTIAYPNGDVPSFYGVCTDVIIRAYRGLGVDLQALVHQSKLGSGDTNIDHRRVGTLQKYFATYGESIPISEFAEDYWPGDVISYYRPQNAHSRSHIAIVSDIVGPSGNFMIIHNRGWGPQQEDALFVDQMTGHYRYSAVRRPNLAPAKALMSKSTAAAKSKAAAGTEQKPAQPPSAGARASLAPVKPAPGDAVAR